MSASSTPSLSKVPEVTLVFWFIKIMATTLGETAGDAVSMSMKLGYQMGTAIFAAVFLVTVFAQIKAQGFHPLLYWITIIATTTVGTTMADYADRSLGVGYAGGSLLLLALLMASLALWHRSLGSVSIATVSTPKAEVFYWVTIMFSQTLGTALGDWTANTAGLGSRVSRQRALAQCAAGAGCCGLFLDPRLSHGVVLGRVHSYTPARCCRGRLYGQTLRLRWPRMESLYGVGRVVAVHSGLHWHLQAKRGETKSLI